jgi:serine/threonine-protein kinase RsbW
VHSKGQNHILEIQSSAAEVSGVQSAIQKEMERFGYDGDTCFAVRLAVEESVVNAVRHGNKFDPALHVEVEFHVTDNEVRIRVRDQGCGFNPADVPDPTREENLAKPHGRGIMLMRAYMDEVTYSACGCEVTLVKRRKKSKS